MNEDGKYESEYKKSNAQDYTEKLNLSSLSRVELKEEPMQQPNRKDKAVFISTNANTKGEIVENKRTSSLMLGKNIDQYGKCIIDLADGTYVSEDEFKQAINNMLSSTKETGKVLLKRTGELDARDIDCLVEIAKKAGKLTIGNPSDKITNQDSRLWSVTGKNGESKKAGIMMLGNNNIQMPKGSYINALELQKALKEYFMMVPQKEQENKYKVVKRNKKTYSVIKFVAEVLTMLTLLSGMKSDDVTKPVIYPTNVTEFTQQGGVDINLVNEKIFQEIFENLVKKHVATLSNGESIQVQEGVEYLESSDAKYGGANEQGNIGNDLRPAGNYTINGLSVLYNGRIYNYTFTQGDNLGNLIQNVANEIGTSAQNIESYVHLDGPTTGWVEAESLIDSNNITEETLTRMISTSYKAKNEDISTGIAIFTNNNGENVKININDANGILVSPGSIVKGSDGKEYRVDKTEKTSNEKAISTEKEEEKQEVVGKKITYKFTEINPILGATAVGMFIAAKKEEQEEAEKENKTGLSKDNFKALEIAKAEYNKISPFKRFLNKMQHRAPDWEKYSERMANGEVSPEEVAEKFNNPSRKGR